LKKKGEKKRDLKSCSVTKPKTGRDGNRVSSALSKKRAGIRRERN